MKFFWQKKTVGLALGSGGAKGLAHIGVIKALEEAEIPIDMIAGSSAGALIGGLYLALGSIKQVEERALNLTNKDIFSLFSGIGFGTGILKSEKIEKYLNEILQNKNIESLSKKYCAVATDIISGDEVRLQNGNLAKAIKASGSIPILIESTVINNQRLVDGGVSQPVPVRAVKKLGADIVIAVNLDTYGPFNSAIEKISVRDVGMASLLILRENLACELCRQADITISPKIPNASSVNLLEFVNGNEKIEAGYDAAKKAIPEIKKRLGRLLS